MVASLSIAERVGVRLGLKTTDPGRLSNNACKKYSE
jgi:hypothetical protein